MDERRFKLRQDQRPDERPLLRIATRLAFIEDAEEESRRRLNRPLTADELRHVLRRYRD